MTGDGIANSVMPDAACSGPRRGIKAEARRAIASPLSLGVAIGAPLVRAPMATALQWRPPPRPGDTVTPRMTSKVMRGVTIKHTRTTVGSPRRGPSMARLPLRKRSAEQARRLDARFKQQQSCTRVTPDRFESATPGLTEPRRFAPGPRVGASGQFQAVGLCTSPRRGTPPLPSAGSRQSPPRPPAAP